MKQAMAEPVANRRAAGNLRLLVLLSVFGLLLPGCGPERLEYREVKRIHEKVTEEELNAFLRIIDSLPEDELPELPKVFVPPPDWKPSRTLPVKDLVQDETEKLEDRWNVELLARQLPRSRSLQRALQRERMTPEQFAGLTLAIGVALSRNTLRENQDVEDILKKGEKRLADLKKNEETFASLAEETRQSILRQAIWITRVERARRLSLVPPENVALVQRYQKELQEIFPAQFTSNPIDSVADLLEEKGLPFEELPGSGRDVEIEWDSEEAFVGTDPVDPEYRAQPQDDQPPRRSLSDDLL